MLYLRSIIVLPCRMAERERSPAGQARMLPLELMLLKRARAITIKQSLMATATTAVGTGIRDVTAGRKAVKKLAKPQKCGNCKGRNLKMKKIRESQPMCAHTPQKTNPIVHGW